MKEREKERERYRQIGRKKGIRKERDCEITLIHTGDQTGPRWRASLGKSGPKIPVFCLIFVSLTFSRAQFFPLLHRDSIGRQQRDPRSSPLRSREKGEGARKTKEEGRDPFSNSPTIIFISKRAFASHFTMEWIFRARFE